MVRRVGLQLPPLNRDAWKGALAALVRLDIAAVHAGPGWLVAAAGAGAASRRARIFRDNRAAPVEGAAAASRAVPCRRRLVIELVHSSPSVCRGERHS